MIRKWLDFLHRKARQIAAQLTLTSTRIVAQRARRAAISPRSEDSRSKDFERGFESCDKMKNIFELL